MADIVQQLRDRAYCGPGVDALCENAAREIERLRGLVNNQNNIGADSLAAPSQSFGGLGKLLFDKMIAAEEEAARFLPKDETDAADNHGDAG